MASTQKYFSTFDSFNKFLEISWRVLFFLFLLHHFVEVLYDMKNCEISHLHQKNCLKDMFSNSPPWSLLTTSKDSSLCFKKNSHVNLEKSSKITNPYLVPLRLVVLTGPNKSMWRSSSGLLVDIIFFEWKLFWLVLL